MKPFRQPRLALVLLAVLVAGLGWQGSAAAQREDYKGSATARGDAPAVTLMLTGTYRLKSDDADLQLQITSKGGTERSGTLLATLLGRFQDRTLNYQGVLHVDNQGRQVLLTVTPSSRKVPSRPPRAPTSSRPPRSGPPAPSTSAPPAKAGPAPPRTRATA